MAEIGERHNGDTDDKEGYADPYDWPVAAHRAQPTQHDSPLSPASGDAAPASEQYRRTLTVWPRSR
jgi:hypothetical protein